jgi:hypothetical protein
LYPNLQVNSITFFGNATVTSDSKIGEKRVSACYFGSAEGRRDISRLIRCNRILRNSLFRIISLNKKLYSGRNYEQIEVRECLLLFGAASFVFQFAIQKFKDQDI